MKINLTEYDHRVLAQALFAMKDQTQEEREQSYDILEKLGLQDMTLQLMMRGALIPIVRAPVRVTEQQYASDPVKYETIMAEYQDKVVEAVTILDSNRVPADLSPSDVDHILAALNRQKDTAIDLIFLARLGRNLRQVKAGTYAG